MKSSEVFLLSAGFLVLGFVFFITSRHSYAMWSGGLSVFFAIIAFQKRSDERREGKGDGGG